MAHVFQAFLKTHSGAGFDPRLLACWCREAELVEQRELDLDAAVLEAAAGPSAAGGSGSSAGAPGGGSGSLSWSSTSTTMMDARNVRF